MFVRSEWPRNSAPPPDASNERRRGVLARALDFIGPRPWPTALFYLLLGLTNLAKGPLVGALPIVGTVAVYLLWNRDGRRIRHYAWLWGWLLFFALTLAWPWWAWRHYPDVVDNWRFDYLGQVEDGATTPAAATKWN